MKRLLPCLWSAVFIAASAAAAWWLLRFSYGVSLGADTFRFERPWAGLLLLAGALVVAARGYIHARRAPRLLISRGHDLSALGKSGRRTWFLHAPTGARAASVLLMALALMGPQSIHARDRAEVHGIDIVLALDLSLSMEAADIRPNRFLASKQVVDDFIRRRPNDRVGAVVFGRDAYTLMPLTTDKTSLRSAISELSLRMIDGRGTAIGNAVGTALNRLRQSDAQSRVVILLTDGDSNSGNVSPEQAAEIARTLPQPQGRADASAGVRIYTVLMGQAAETRVKTGTDLFGRPVFDRGNFPINPELLRTMAEKTDGEFFQVTDRAGLERSFHAILDRLERSEIEDVGRVYGELYPAFLWPALCLLLLELLAASLWLRRWP